jgi:hypothetical protein
VRAKGRGDPGVSRAQSEGGRAERLCATAEGLKIFVGRFVAAAGERGSGAEMNTGAGARIMGTWAGWHVRATRLHYDSYVACGSLGVVRYWRRPGESSLWT